MELRAALERAAPGARVSTGAPDLSAYTRDLWPRGLVELADDAPVAPPPPAIVWPETVEHVAGLVRAARAEGFTLVPFGAGSGVCGGAEGGPHSVVVDLKRMKGFEVGAGPTVTAGAGALGLPLERDLLERGFTIGHYPSSILCSTVGGWVAARGAGQCSGLYGKIEDMVTSIECVLGNGEILRARRRSEGPNLLPLLVGSEGTLGIVTRVGLRLHPAPIGRAFAAFSFPSVRAGLEALRRLYQDGHRPAVARLYDPLDSVMLAQHGEPGAAPRRSARGSALRGAALRAVLKAPALVARALFEAEKSLLRRASLVLVHEGGEPSEVERRAALAGRVCEEAGGRPLGEGPARAWLRRRYAVSYRQSAVFRAGAFSDTMEVAAPWSRLDAVYEGVRSALGRHVLVMAHVSHAYPDGASIYFTFAGTEHGGSSALEVYDRAWRAALTAALAAGASLSHHHGVGRSKAPRLGEDLGAAVSVVRALKAAWDPDGVLNPGALLPPEGSGPETRLVPEPSSEPALDAVSGLAELPGALPLREVDAWLALRGHTLDLDPAPSEELGQLSIDAWLGRGMPGRRDAYADPVLAPLAGFTARLAGGRRFTLRPSPRRAVGPDLSALFVGAGGAFGTVERAVLVAPRRGAAAAPPLAFDAEREPPLDASERAALECVASAFRSK